jgi:hypothetical protein
VAFNSPRAKINPPDDYNDFEMCEYAKNSAFEKVHYFLKTGVYIRR